MSLIPKFFRNITIRLTNFFKFHSTNQNRIAMQITVVGIDNMGNSENCLDHVIILGDTYDTSDHLNDGFYVIGLDKFYYNWQSNEISYLENSTGTFVVIHRKKGNQNFNYLYRKMIKYFKY